MSIIRNDFNGKWRSAADLDNVVINMENNLKSVNKTFINNMLKALNSLMVTVQHKEAGIFDVVLKLFRLYMKVFITINPHDKKLLKHYESTIPTIITYIIGCLQYKTKEVPNYHYDLLVILDELLENVPDEVLNEITKFEVGTIGCLWNPIDLAGDFNTQSMALKILAILLKQFDDIRQNEELKCIKWTNLNLFQDKLKTIVQETKLTHVIENRTRELLNNYNMNLSKNVMVYSFYCSGVIMDNKYTFYKPLNLQKFWIDINYSPKTMSFKARFKLNTKTKYKDINVILKIQIMKLQNNTLLVYFKTPGYFSNYSHYLTNLTNNVIQFSLNQEEVKRLKTNNYVMDYFNSLNEKSHVKLIKTQNCDKNIFDLLKKEMSANLQDYKRSSSKSNSNSSKIMKSKYQSFIESTPEKEKESAELTYLHNLQCENFNMDVVESPKTSRNKENDMKKHPIRNLRNRKKFFTSMLVDSDEKIIQKTSHKRRSKSRKPRQTKSRCKQVCKVTPTVDLTKIDNNMDTIKQNIEKPIIEDIITEKTPPFLTTQDCNEVLQQVANIYEVADTTYDKPCQSYRNFKLQPNLLTETSNVKNSEKIRSRKKKINKTDNESSMEKIRKLTNDCSLENKENINPQNHTVDSNICSLAKTKSIISPHLFETQCSDNTTPVKISRVECNQINFVENLQIDLTQDEIVISEPTQNIEINNGNNSSSDSIECEEVRGLNDNSLKDLQYICTPNKSILYNSSEMNTPRPTSCMNISDLNDSDMEITPVVNNQKFLMERLNENNAGNTASDMITYPTNNNPNFIVNQPTEKPSCLQTDNEVMNENMEIPNCLQEILNDFELNSDDNLYSNNEMAYNQRNYNQSLNNNPIERDYYKDCFIYQKRTNTEVSDSSEDDDNYHQFPEIQMNSNNKNNQNFIIMQNQPLYLNQNLDQNNNVWTTPVKNDVISSNVTTTMATNCQVTPTAVIVQQIQVSAKKSIILRNTKSRKDLKANKSLNNYFQNMNTNQQLMELRKDKALQMPSSKNHTKFNHFIYHNDQTNSKKYQNYCYHKTNALEKQQHKEVDIPVQDLPKTLRQQLPNLMNRKQIIDRAKYANPYETPSTNPTTQTQYDGNDDHFEQQLSPYNSNITEESKNSYDNNNNSSSGFLTTVLEYPEISFKRDIIQIINDFNKNFQLRLNNAQQMCLKNVSILYTEKICEITQNISNKFQKHNNELEEIRFNIERLVRELERQYDKFVNKLKQFDVQKETMKLVLESISNRNIPNFLNQEYEELIQQLNIEENEVVEKLWRKYLENHKK